MLGLGLPESTEPEPATSPALEVLEYEQFARSKSPRMDRRGIKYRVGQVVKHRKYGYRGIIVGWDRQAKAITSLAMHRT